MEKEESRLIFMFFHPLIYKRRLLLYVFFYFLGHKLTRPSSKCNKLD